ncbi:hypothetical protein [Psychrobacillus soli]|uniref:Uncharacterized protein n=1 Tax=Psychrobacillus soli TaxID=1543965 RepID=A0A544T656_9BACI|nr:hypothetical protein [Psychrobacillus soli]TQR12943.1 hypothetical protein FG383_12840 [Psychrobacillus soli]
MSRLKDSTKDNVGEKMILLLQLSLFLTIATLFVGVFRMSWVFLLISTFMSIPISYYLSGANNALKYASLSPIILLFLTIFMWFISKKIKKPIKG